MSVVPVVWRCRAVGVKALTEPLALMSGAYLLYYVFRGLVFLFRDSIAAQDVVLRLNPATSKDLALALGYVTVGFVAFHLGYRFWNPPASGRRIWSAWSSAKINRMALWGIGIAVFSTLVSIYAAGGLVSTINKFGRLREITAGYGYALLGLSYWSIAFAFLLRDRLHQRKSILVPLVLLVISNICDAFFGNRTGVMATWTTGFLLYAYSARGQKSARTAVLLVAVLTAAVGFALPMARAREYAKSMNDVFRIGRKYWFTNTGTNVTVRVLDEFVALDSFAALIQAGPAKFPFRYGGTYLDSVLFVVPRRLWPDKPRSFSFAVGKYVFDAYSDFPPGYVGELYINFHIVGVLLGMYLMGLFLRKTHQWTLSGDPVALTVYSVLIPYLVIFMGRSFIGGGTLTLIPLVLMLPVMYFLRAAFTAGRKTRAGHMVLGFFVSAGAEAERHVFRAGPCHHVRRVGPHQQLPAIANHRRRPVRLLFSRLRLSHPMVAVGPGGVDGEGVLVCALGGCRLRPCVRPRYRLTRGYRVPVTEHPAYL